MKIFVWIVSLFLPACVAVAQYGAPFHTGLPSEPVQGYFQPVCIQTPEGTHLAGVIAGQFSERLPRPLQAGFLIGNDYRLRITDIPFHPGKELFPTITLLARTYPPQGKELDFPIVISLTFEDIELALEGQYVTRVIYLENPKTALPVQSGPILSGESQITHDIHSGDPIALAATQGLPVAILRIGGRVPPGTEGKLPPEFCFGSPAWILNRTIPSAPEIYVSQSDTKPNPGLTIDPRLQSKGAAVLEQQPQHQLGRRANEYLINGNDSGVPAYVEGWTAHNFGTADTVAHFDTLDGKVIVEPSNQVYIYSPRFGSVRKAEGLVHEGQVTALIETQSNQFLLKGARTIQTGYTAQESQTQFTRTKDQLNSIEGQRRGTGVGSSSALGGYDNVQTADSSISLLQAAFKFEGSARTQWEYGSANARAWQGNEAVKIQINELAPITATGIDGAAAYFVVEDKRSKTSKLRLIKVASKDSAQPGDVIEFTLRFDNIGTELIGNVTILDDLSGRLEFLSGSAVASLSSGFAPEVNKEGSLTLRFEITDPLKPGDFGVIRFQCRVR